MEITKIMILKILVQIICFGGAIYIMSLGKDGWGWLIFSGIAISPYCETKKEVNNG